MDPRMAQELCRHNNWANNHVLDVAAGLTSEQLARPVGGSFPSVQATLTHILWAEWMWLERWKGGSSRRVFTVEDLPSLTALKTHWHHLQAEQVDFVQRLTTDGLRRVVRYVNLKGEKWEYPLWRQLYHVLAHSSYHRGQVTNQFRQLGIPARTTDFLNYCDEVGRAAD